jgi:hypothetical protein
MANSKVIYSRSVPPSKTSHDEISSAIQAFLQKGGKIQKLRDDSSHYDKALKKTQENLTGGFNPFTREQALTINKKDFLP